MKLSFKSSQLNPNKRILPICQSLLALNKDSNPQSLNSRVESHPRATWPKRCFTLNFEVVLRMFLLFWRWVKNSLKYPMWKWPQPKKHTSKNDLSISGKESDSFLSLRNFNWGLQKLTLARFLKDARMLNWRQYFSSLQVSATSAWSNWAIPWKKTGYVWCCNK